MDEKEPTQQTQPKKGEPITIPVPTRDEIDQAIAKVAAPIVENQNPGHPLAGDDQLRDAPKQPPVKEGRKGRRK